MDKIIKNANEYPKRLYGLHMTEGVAQYRIAPDRTEMMFIGCEAIKAMDKTFDGKPVFVGHVTAEMTKPENLHLADGYVVKSFYNQADGKHWCEFLITSDRAHEAIRSGWRLSNAYKVKKVASGGKWHGVDYDEEVIEGEYEHLAIVDDPRYTESIVLNPEQFKEYNEQKENELKRLTNSQQTGVKGMFKFFKKTTVENNADMENMTVVLPKTGREVEIKTLINEADEEKKENEADKDVEIDGKKVTLNELIETYKNSMKKKNESDEKKEEEKKENSETEVIVKKENDMDAEAGKGGVHVDVDSHKENEADEEKKDDEKTKQNSSDENFKTLLNADTDFEFYQGPVIEIGMDKVARGQKRYGSK